MFQGEANIHTTIDDQIIAGNIQISYMVTRGDNQEGSEKIK